MAASLVGRKAEEIKLVVVTKGHPVETLQAVLAAGACCLGENYVEHALPKIEALAGQEIEWHMIGHLQRNKARKILPHTALIHSIDSVRLLRAVARIAKEESLVQHLPGAEG